MFGLVLPRTFDCVERTTTSLASGPHGGVTNGMDMFSLLIPMNK